MGQDKNLDPYLEPDNILFSPQPVAPVLAPATGQFPSLSMEQISRAQKLCKFAVSSLDYQDSKTAVENLNKALFLIQTGQEPQ